MTLGKNYFYKCTFYKLWNHISCQLKDIVEMSVLKENYNGLTFDCEKLLFKERFCRFAIATLEKNLLNLSQNTHNPKYISCTKQNQKTHLVTVTSKIRSKFKHNAVSRRNENHKHFLHDWWFCVFLIWKLLQ